MYSYTGRLGGVGEVEDYCYHNPWTASQQNASSSALEFWKILMFLGLSRISLAEVPVKAHGSRNIGDLNRAPGPFDDTG